MMAFITANWGNIVTIAAFIAAIVYLVKTGQKKKASTMLFWLVIKAEEIYGGGTGALKYAAVTTWIYERLPGIMKILFTDEELDDMIEDAVREAKKYLEKNSHAETYVQASYDIQFDKK